MILLPLAPPVEALVYTTLPCLFVNRPTLTMDGDEKTAFRSYRDMGENDDFMVILSAPVEARSVQIVADRLENGRVETSADGETFTLLGAVGEDGTLKGRPKGLVRAVRVRGSGPLMLKELQIESATPIGRALRGPGRGFHDLSQAPDLKSWADRAGAQMEAFWPQTEAILHSDGFVPPNKVNVVYRTGEGVTGVAAVSGGQMEVNSAWCREHPEDTGLTVHEAAHVIQSGGSPGWLVEAVADYVRWIRFEPENFTPRIDPRNKDPRQPYRTGATFLAWCELNYDRKLVTKLNDDSRFGRYRDSLFERYCGKPLNALYAEFLTAYERDPAAILKAPAPPAPAPRTVPDVTAGTSVAVPLPANAIGVTPDGERYEHGGFDGAGWSYSASGLGNSVEVNGVRFEVLPPGSPNALSAQGQEVPLSGKRASLWILGAAIGDAQRDQEIVVEYADGTTARFEQSFSDWYAPEDFAGETIALKLPYRNRANGTRDPRPFQIYAYGFALDPAKELKSVSLPGNDAVRIVAISVAD